MIAYYNEIDPDAAHILRALIADGVIAPGDVDTRSIKEVQPDDLRPYTQCHFFAGGGLWSVAARMAGWVDDRPLWTGSCPCQPFSGAGKGGGIDDPRHLWPDFFRLIRSCRPPVVVGEQVAGTAGYGWLDGVRVDLAGENYASRGVDIPACAVDAPHIRQRLYWVALNMANTPSIGRGARGPQFDVGITHANASSDFGHAFGSGLEGQSWHGNGSAGWTVPHRSTPAADGSGRDMANPNVFVGRFGDEQPAGQQQVHEPHAGTALRSGSRNGSWWADHDWIACHDGKARRAQPGVPMLVDGLPGRVGLWRVAGNAISPVLAAEVIGALMDTLDHKDIAA